MPVQLIAIDLDDTLLTPELEIHPSNLSSVRRALASGIDIVLASGRTIESMIRFADELGLRGRSLPMICVNGSEIRDVDTGAMLRRVTLSEEACLTAIRELESHGLPVQAYDDDGIIASRRNDWTDKDSELTGLPARIASTPEEIASEPRSKLLSAGTPEQVARFAPLLRKRLAGVAEILISKPYFIEILPPGADKGEALAWVAAQRSVPRENVMAIGDSGNDIGMISWAGFGCAPADARADVIAVARYVSELAHDHGAVSELIDRYALEGARRR